MSSWFARLYVLAGAAALIGYLMTEARGAVFFDAVDDKTTLPTGAKGNRRHSFWYSGYMGGK